MGNILRGYAFLYATILYNKLHILSFLHTPNGPQTPSDTYVTSGIVQAKNIHPVQVEFLPQNGPSDGTKSVLDHPQVDHPTFCPGQTQLSLGAHLEKYLLGLIHMRNY